MKFFFFFLCAISATSILAQTQSYDVVCVNNQPVLRTSQDTNGVVIDTAGLVDQIQDIDKQLEEISIAEYELKLLKQRRELAVRREVVEDILEKANNSCQ